MTHTFTDVFSKIFLINPEIRDCHEITYLAQRAPKEEAPKPLYSTSDPFDPRAAWTDLD